MATLEDMIFDVNRKLVDAIDITSERLLDKLCEIIRGTVYSYNATWDNGWDGGFGRTGEFEDSWQKTEAKIRGDIVESEIWQDARYLSHDLWSHGNPWSSLPAEALDDIIENGLSESNFNFPAIKPRHFWSEFIQYAESGGLDSIFQQACREVGLDIVPEVGYSYTTGA